MVYLVVLLLFFVQHVKTVRIYANFWHHSFQSNFSIKSIFILSFYILCRQMREHRLTERQDIIAQLRGEHEGQICPILQFGMDNENFSF